MSRPRLSPWVALVIAGAAMACGGARSRPSPAPPLTPLTPLPAMAPLPPPPPPRPTTRLPRNYLPSRVTATLALDPARPVFDGVVAIEGEVTEAATTIWLHGRDLAVASAHAARAADTVDLTVTSHGDDLLELRAGHPLEPGSWTLVLRYQGRLVEGEAAGAFRQYVDQAPYVFTQLQPIDARRVFPCLDEPDVKVPWRLSLEVPRGLVAVANTPVASESAIAGDRVRIEFEPTRPLPSYLIAFGVGPFELVEAGHTRAGAPIRIVVPKGRRRDAAWAATSTARVVAILEDWFGTPYPYAKLDQLVIPMTSGFGAMENAGLVTYASSLALMDPDRASLRQRHDWVAVAGHELAHQWFGNLVTTAWWDDLWLNEAFATWMEDKVLTAFDPTWRDELGRTETHWRALRADRLASARRMREPITGAGDIVNAFDPITYDKGASVLSMFEHDLGAEVFQAGVRAYLARHAWGNATARDFSDELSAAAGRDVGPQLSTFLDQAGAPQLEFTVRCDGPRPMLELSQRRYLPSGAPSPTGAPPIWQLPVCVAFEREGGRAEQCVVLASAQVTVPLATTSCPRWLWPNVGGRGYYVATQSSAAVAAVRTQAWPHLTSAERLVGFADARIQAELGQLPIGELLRHLSTILAERNRFAVVVAVGLIETLQSTVPPARRAAFDGWIRAWFGADARRLGWLPRAGDTLDDEATRHQVVALVAAAHDRRLRAQAVKLAPTWRRLPPAARAMVLDAAADASPRTFARLRADLATTSDRAARDDIIAALARVSRPDQQRLALALTLDPALDTLETSGILFSARGAAQAAVAQDFFREHAQTLLARLPSSVGNRAVLAYIFMGCDAARRDDNAAYMQATFASAEGGGRMVAQAIERMDQCIARAQLIGPELDRWLDRAPARR